MSVYDVDTERLAAAVGAQERRACGYSEGIMERGQVVSDRSRGCSSGGDRGRGGGVRHRSLNPTSPLPAVVGPQLVYTHQTAKEYTICQLNREEFV